MTLTNLPAPFAPLVSGGDGLERYPAEPRALAARMAEVYGVPADCVLPVRGATHGFELVFRLAARQAAPVTTCDIEPFVSLRSLFPSPAEGRSPFAVVTSGGDSLDRVRGDARAFAPALCVVDEGAVEFADNPSAAALVADTPNLVVLRSLSLAYGLAGARVGALIAPPRTIELFRTVLEPFALPEPSVRLALQALDPSRLRETEARVARVREERARMAAALDGMMRIGGLTEPLIRVQPAGVAAVTARLTALGIPYQSRGIRGARR